MVGPSFGAGAAGRPQPKRLNAPGSNSNSSSSGMTPEAAAAAAAAGAAATASGSIPGGPGWWARVTKLIGEERISAAQAKAAQAASWATAQAKNVQMKVPVDVKVDMIGPQLQNAQRIAEDIWSRVPPHRRPYVTHGAAGAGGAALATLVARLSLAEEKAKRKAAQSQIAQLLRDRDEREAEVERIRREGPNRELELKYAQTIAELSSAAIQATKALMIATGPMRGQLAMDTAGPSYPLPPAPYDAGFPPLPPLPPLPLESDLDLGPEGGARRNIRGGGGAGGSRPRESPNSGPSKASSTPSPSSSPSGASGAAAPQGQARPGARDTDARVESRTGPRAPPPPAHAPTWAPQEGSGWPGQDAYRAGWEEGSEAGPAAPAPYGGGLGSGAGAHGYGNGPSEASWGYEHGSHDHEASRPPRRGQYAQGGSGGYGGPGAWGPPL